MQFPIGNSKHLKIAVGGLVVQSAWFTAEGSRLELIKGRLGGFELTLAETLNVSGSTGSSTLGKVFRKTWFVNGLGAVNS